MKIPNLLSVDQCDNLLEKFKKFPNQVYHTTDPTFRFKPSAIGHFLVCEMSLNECAIFFRTHSQSRLFEDYLLKENIPYVIIGGLSFYQRKEIKDILAWLRMTLASTDFIAFSRTINLPKRGLGDTTLQKLREAIEKYKTDILTCIQSILNNQIPCKLSAKQLQGLREYIDLILSLQKSALQKTKLSLLIEQIIHQSHYFDYLREDPDSYQDRRGNIEELPCDQN